MGNKSIINRFTKSLFFLFFSTYLVNIAYPQGEANIWYFGQNAGLDFNGGAPVVITNGMINTIEGCASICDASGNLLFYTDGQTVYNRVHAVMTNGAGLLGRTSSTQTAMVVPVPGSSSQYYIFTTDAEPNPCSTEGASIAGLRNGLRYTIVDMSVGANGSVVLASKNIALQADPVMEGMTAIPVAGSADYWLITHGVNNNTFTVRRMGSAGVVSTTNTNIGHTVSSNCRYISSIKANSCYTKIGIAYHEDHLIQILDFNNTTGVISNPVTITTNNFPYGLEFSPNGSYLYYTDDIYTGGAHRVMQYNIGTATSTLVGNGPAAHDRIGAMQLGPDGKIYIANLNWSGSTYLSVIGSPNNAAASAGYSASGILTGSGSVNLSQMGLPNYIRSFVASILEINDPGIVCPNVSKTFGYTFTGSKYTGGGTVVTWNWGDASANTINVDAPTHTYTTNGDYTITLTVKDNCGIDHTETLEITVYGNTPAGTLNCSGSNTLVMTGTGAGTANYMWFDPGYVGSGASASKAYTPASSAPTTVYVRDMYGITTHPTLHPFSSTAHCNGDATQTTFTVAKTVFLESVKVRTYSWSPVGNITVSIVVTGPSGGSYSFSISDNAETTIPLNLTLTAGSYTMSVANGLYCGSDLTSPASATGIATITGGDGAGNVPKGGPFTNFKFTDYNSCSPMVPVTRVCALPIELLNFFGTHSSNGISLNWVSTSERNSKSFEVEKSQDGINFTNIGEVPAAGNSNTSMHYQLTDSRISEGKVYYRLKLVDLDGSFEYSKIIVIETEAALITAVPNPFQGSATLAFFNSSEALVQITDLSGKMVYETNKPDGINSLVIGTNLMPGTYIISVVTDEKSYHFKVVKN